MEKVKFFLHGITVSLNPFWKPIAVFAPVLLLAILLPKVYYWAQSNSLRDGGLAYLVTNHYVTPDLPRPTGGFKYTPIDFTVIRSQDSISIKDNISQKERAVIDLQKAFQLNSKNFSASQYLGTYYLVIEKDFAKAQQQYFLVFAQDFANSTILNDLGILAWHQGDYIEATKKFLLALKHDPSLWEAQYNLATVYQKQGEVEKAREAWKKYLTLDPKSDWAKVAKYHSER